MDIVLSVAVALIGLGCCLFGFAVFRLFTGFCGLLLGVFLAYRISLPLASSAVWVTAVCALSGLVFAALSVFFIRIGAVVSGFALGMTLAGFVLFALHSEQWIGALISGAAMALLALLWVEGFSLYGSAVGGACALFIGVFAALEPLHGYSLLSPAQPLSGTIPALLLTGTLFTAFVGSLVQRGIKRYVETKDL